MGSQFWIRARVAAMTSNQENVTIDHEDQIADHLLIRIVHAIAWLITVVLSLLSLGFTCYQVSALYLPYIIAKATGNTAYRFPDYFYKVWGDDAKELTSEHWGYLAAI